MRTTSFDLSTTTEGRDSFRISIVVDKEAERVLFGAEGHATVVNEFPINTALLRAICHGEYRYECRFPAKPL